MANLSDEQQALKDSIKKSGMIWGAILGVIAAAIGYWALGGQSTAIQGGVAAAIGAATFGLISSWRIKANSAAAACAKCNATFSITRTDRAEEVKSSENKETRDAQPDHSTEVVTWVEDTIEVTDTYTCAKCNDATTKQYTKTVKRDEVETVEPAPEKPKEKTAEQPENAGDAKDAPAGEGWFSDSAKDAAPEQAEGVATSSKGKSGGKGDTKK